MENPKFRWFDLGKLVEGLIRSADIGQVEIKQGGYMEENTTKLNGIRSDWKGVYPDIRGRIPLDIGGCMGYIFVEQGIRHTKYRRFERYERLKLRVKGGITIDGVSDFRTEYSITEELNGENAGKLYENRKDYVKDGGHWVESDLSRALPSTYFRKDSVTVTTKQKTDWHYKEWHLLLGKIDQIFHDIQI